MNLSNVNTRTSIYCINQTERGKDTMNQFPDDVLQKMRAVMVDSVARSIVTASIDALKNTEATAKLETA